MATTGLFKLTAEGKRKLEEEYEYLCTEKRQEVSEKIKVALGFGDLSENSEYDEAKNEQAQVESRIMELEGMLRNCELIDETAMSNGVVRIGSKIKVLDEEFNEELEYQIVGSTEANPLMGCISDESPVGKALLGCGVGDEVEIETPGGTVKMRVLDIMR